MDNLESRIRALEASNRRQRYSITALAGIIVGGAFIAATRPVGDATFDTITCKSWNIVDKDGKVRIGAEVRPNGDASMLWLDKDGKPRILASTLAGGSAAMSFLDKDAEIRIVASTSATGVASVHCFDKDGRARIIAGTTPDGGADMAWYDKDGKAHIGAATKTDGTVTLPTTHLKPKP